jgi:ElaB/YqjD/DUF883 family membrane-anchored ribosome-binding protein
MQNTSRRESKDTGSTTSELKEKITDQFEKMADQATDKFMHVADQVEGVASQAVEHGREIGEQVQQVAGNFKSALDKSVKNQPMTTLALAAALGFLLGALWKS